ncbi:hypothetical protein H072_4718 [Dactylellina haptotyla CBS 200.50]|uniref:Interferon-related developmental regulator N-terminal domain-containing protein n=1 Tax=Dactylellina haptotyla (strain CBS 200.50) TaxID=1284197 RepID=S8AEE7_DACHA|nr:hypothetical protein H072_4718 [Dactylellina haptotyla CBS 200.50]
MSDLRRRALGGGKTPSKRSTSKAGSKSTSKAGSKATSAAASRHGTDDEAAWDSDGSVWRYITATTIPEDLEPPRIPGLLLLTDDLSYSFGSMGEEVRNLEDVPHTSSWQEDLADRIVRITDKDMRKKLATGGLEEALTAYNRHLQSRFSGAELEGKTTSIIDALSRSIRAGKTDKETTLACQAMVLTLITDNECTTFGDFNIPLQRLITDHESLVVKTAAIHALGALAFFTEPGTEDIEGIMDFFHEIVENDGHTIGAGDDPATVAAAIEEWGLLLTHIDDAEDVTDRSAEAFVEQLESTEIEVQVASGEVIALLVEKAHRDANSDDEESDDQVSGDEYPSGFIITRPDTDSHGPIQKYTVYRNQPRLKQMLTDLSRSSTKSVSKKNRRTQHATFANVLHTVNYPLHGPNYSRALDLDGREQGSRLEVKVGRKGVVKLNSWWKLIRWNALRRFLGGGILVHWQENPLIFHSLPLIMDTPASHKKSSGRIDRMTLSPYD